MTVKPTIITPSPDLTYITPGVGSITDASGNVFTITAAGAATEAIGGANPKALVGGEGTNAIEYSDSVVYFQDASSLTWYTWTGVKFTIAAAPPTPTDLVGQETLAGVNKLLTLQASDTAAIRADIAALSSTQSANTKTLAAIQAYLTGQVD
jgi:hypothetical protein